LDETKHSSTLPFTLVLEAIDQEGRISTFENLDEPLLLYTRFSLDNVKGTSAIHSHIIEQGTSEIAKEDLLLISNDRDLLNYWSISTKEQPTSQPPDQAQYTFGVISDVSNTSWRTKMLFSPSATMYHTLHEQRRDGKKHHWYCWKVFNAVTQKREFLALHSIGDNPLLPTILQPNKSAMYQAASTGPTLEILSQKYVDNLKARLNLNQVPHRNDLINC
jgi:hypothetical protein